MKFVTVLTALLVFSSCEKLQRIMDGTENLPNQIQETNDGMKKTNEAIRKQKIGVAFEILKDEKMRANLIPIPFDMMSAAKMMAEALTAEEVVLFVKNYIIYLNKAQSVDAYPPMDEEKFQHERMADYYMLMLISGFLPEATVKEMIEKESNQGAYQNIMLNILKLRVDFNSDMMLVMGVLGLNPNEKDAGGNYKVIDENSKLDTLGKIEKAIEYNEIVENVCNLDFAEKVDIQIEGFKLKPLDKELAKQNWNLILTRAQSDYTAQSLSNDPEKNEADVKAYTEKFNTLLEKIKTKTGVAAN